MVEENSKFKWFQDWDISLKIHARYQYQWYEWTCHRFMLKPISRHLFWPRICSFSLGPNMYLVRDLIHQSSILNRICRILLGPHNLSDLQYLSSFCRIAYWDLNLHSSIFKCLNAFFVPSWPIRVAGNILEPQPQPVKLNDDVVCKTDPLTLSLTGVCSWWKFVPPWLRYSNLCNTVHWIMVLTAIEKQ